MVEVMQHPTGINPKLAMPYEGPYEIVNTDNSSFYNLDINGKITSIPAHRLKKFSGRLPTSDKQVPDYEELLVDPHPQLNRKDLIGRRIAVYWTTYDTWYPGRVISIHRKQHWVHYDDGDTHLERLIGYKLALPWKLLVPKPILVVEDAHLSSKGGV